MLKIKQQQFALRITLFILLKNGFDRPPKRQVLNFLRMRRLLRFSTIELHRRHPSDHDEIWENDIAWKRKDLFLDGEVGSPERGHWCLTKLGVEKIERQKCKWMKLESPAERYSALKHFDYWTEELLQWMLKIARDENLDLSIRSDASYPLLNGGSECNGHYTRV